MYLQRAIPGAMMHETAQPLDEISAVSFNYKQLNDRLVSIQNKAGEKGFFLSEGSKRSIEQQSIEVTKRLSVSIHSSKCLLVALA